MSMTYAGVGVVYEILDDFKTGAQDAASRTSQNICRLNGGKYREFSPSRGESAFLIETPDNFLAHVEEGLGTKNLVADAMYELMGKSYYDQIAQCTAAMIVNDLITVGALPLSVAMHLAGGDSPWFDDKVRVTDLVNGWKNACDLARCVWGGGETPTLKDIIIPGTVVLAGSAIGVVEPKERLVMGKKIKPDDAIVLIGSNGIHANGLTLARKISAKLLEGYLTKLPDGRTYGESLLDPTHIYVGLVEDCFNAGVDIHGAINITGHGWRKLMRANEPFTYRIKELPRQLPIFDFIQKHGPVDNLEAYGNLNMGAGFALYVPQDEAPVVLRVARRLGFEAHVAGQIEEGPKQVIIEPVDLVFEGDTLAVR